MTRIFYLMILFTAILTAHSFADQKTVGSLSFQDGDSTPYYGCYRIVVNNISLVKYADSYFSNESTCQQHVNKVIKEFFIPSIENKSEVVVTYKTVDFSKMNPEDHEFWWCFDSGYYTEEPDKMPTYNFITSMTIDGQDVMSKLPCPK